MSEGPALEGVSFEVDGGSNLSMWDPEHCSVGLVGTGQVWVAALDAVGLEVLLSLLLRRDGFASQVSVGCAAGRKGGWIVTLGTALCRDVAPNSC